MADSLNRNEAGDLMLPLAGQEVPEPLLTNSQFVDWIRVTQRLMPLSFDSRGRKKATEEPAEVDSTEDEDDPETWLEAIPAP